MEEHQKRQAVREFQKHIDQEHEQEEQVRLEKEAKKNQELIKKKEEQIKEMKHKLKQEKEIKIANQLDEAKRVVEEYSRKLDMLEHREVG